MDARVVAEVVAHMRQGAQHRVMVATLFAIVAVVVVVLAVLPQAEQHARVVVDSV